MFEITQEFKFFADSLPQIVWTSRPDGNLDYFNKSWYRLTGLSFDESRDLGIQSIIHPDEKSETVKRWKNSFENGVDFEMEYRLKDHQGHYRWYIARAIPMRGPDGDIVKWFGTCTSIHKQKEQAIELEKVNYELEKLHNDLDNLVYTASHELKVPASNLEGLVANIYDMVSHKSFDDDCELIADLMKQSVNQLYVNINQLVNMTKAQKKLNGHYFYVKLPGIIHQVMDDLKAQLNASKAKIDIDLKEPQICFTAANTKSVLYNLVSNAIKFRKPDQKCVVKISTWNENGHTVLSVKDHGIGIEPKEENRYFNMFKNLNEHIEGSGLGLYTVKKMVENAGGFIDVYGQEGVGAEFRLHFKNQ
ncbi:PAS domain-containing sensor histidine kinase [Cytophagaceae bacterium ABcell3]|nr:PAS domain-containing sensor histidine kinase [Cytophagaceae bacterium ABcell3]